MIIGDISKHNHCQNHYTEVDLLQYTDFGHVITWQHTCYNNVYGSESIILS